MQKDSEQKMYDACYALLKACCPQILGYTEKNTKLIIQAPSDYAIKKAKAVLDQHDADLIVAAMKKLDLEILNQNTNGNSQENYNRSNY